VPVLRDCVPDPAGGAKSARQPTPVRIPDLPLAQIHPHARQAAQAAEAAGAQGKFWETHDALFENQNALEEADLLRYARMLELDTERIEREVKAQTFAKRVRDDFRSGISSGANNSPTFFMNGERYYGSWENVDVFTRVLRDAAQQASRHIPHAAEAYQLLQS
jgi:protein-disulfide isomerase